LLKKGLLKYVESLIAKYKIFQSHIWDFLCTSRRQERKISEFLLIKLEIGWLCGRDSFSHMEADFNYRENAKTLHFFSLDRRV
jgi:hypothetical protein